MDSIPAGGSRNGIIYCRDIALAMLTPAPIPLALRPTIVILKCDMFIWVLSYVSFDGCAI